MRRRFAQLALTAAAGALAAACATAPASNNAQAGAYANYLVGRVANMREDHQAASDRLYRALLAAPNDATLMDGALTAALATGDVERARSIARMNVARGDEPPAYQNIVRGIEALNAGRFRQAREQLTAARGDAASELTARMLLTWARTGEGQVDQVTLELSRLSSMRPYGGLFAYQQAMALDLAGRTAEAKTAYGAAERGGLFLPPGAERHADLLVRLGDRDGALAILRAADGRATNPALAAAAARVDAGQAAAAQPLTASRGGAVGLYGLAAIFAQETDSTHALATLTLAIMLDPNLDAARLSFAEQQADLRHPDQARAALDRIPATSPYAESAKVMQAWVLMQEGRRDEALALAQATARNGTPRAKRALADMYRNLDRDADAEPIYTALIDAQPAGQQDWRLYFSRGVARQELNRWPEAEADMRRALELSPDQPEVLNYLGYTWVDRGEHLQEGLAMIQRAAAIRPMSGAIIDSLGWAYYRLGRYDQALENLERAVELSPADPVLNDHLGDVYWRLNRRTEARFQWRRALTLEPTAEDRTAIEQKIERGLPPPQTARR